MGQPEGRLAHTIIEMIKKRGGFVWKQHGNEFMPAGLPDIIGSYRGLFIGIETKMPDNELSARQKYMHLQIRRAGGQVLAPCREVREAVRWLDRIDEQLRGRIR